MGEKLSPYQTTTKDDQFRVPVVPSLVASDGFELDACWSRFATFDCHSSCKTLCLIAFKKRREEVFELFTFAMKARNFIP